MTPQTAPAKVALDASLAGTTISAPIWMANLETYVGLAIALGGFILLVLRILLSWRELRGRGKNHGRRKDDE
jgi:hypothetical protein